MLLLGLTPVDFVENTKATPLQGSFCSHVNLEWQKHDAEILHEAYTSSFFGNEAVMPPVWDPREQWSIFTKEERNGIDPASKEVEQLQSKLVLTLKATSEMLGDEEEKKSAEINLEDSQPDRHDQNEERAGPASVIEQNEQPGRSKLIRWLLDEYC